MEKIKKIIDKVILTFSSVVLLLLVLAVSWQVVSRYVLNSPSSFTDEFARFSLIWIGMLGAAYAFGCNAHLAIDMLVTKVQGKVLKVVKIVICLLVIGFLISVMVIGGGILTMNTLTQISPALEIPMGYVYSILPFTGILNTCYIVIELVKILGAKNIGEKLEAGDTRIGETKEHAVETFDETGSEIKRAVV